MQVRSIFFVAIVFAYNPFDAGKVLFDTQQSIVISPRSYLSGYTKPAQKAIERGLLVACREMLMYDCKEAPANFYILGMSIFQDRIYPLCKELEAEINNVFELMTSSVEIVQCPASGQGYSEGVDQVLLTVKSVHGYLKAILGEIFVHARMVPCSQEIDRIRRIEKAKDLCKKLSRMLIACNELELNKSYILMATDELHTSIITHFCEHRNNHMCCLEEIKKKPKPTYFIVKSIFGITFTIAILLSIKEIAKRF